MGPVNKNTKSIFSSFNFDKGYSVLAKENKTVLSASNTPTWIEPEPLHLTLGIKIENLTKVIPVNLFLESFTFQTNFFNRFTILMVKRLWTT